MPGGSGRGVGTEEAKGNGCACCTCCVEGLEDFESGYRAPVIPSFEGTYRPSKPAPVPTFSRGIWSPQIYESGEEVYFATAITLSYPFLREEAEGRRVSDDPGGILHRKLKNLACSGPEVPAGSLG